ncbi:MAG: HD-GYP domain-containing protein [Treponema sp.]|jgi:HD-GYP domain-containing protein (c-di-GMP phosphodiesterase class II)|nr:HD-GYP domain-containing protein [Treponema sp.]
MKKIEVKSLQAGLIFTHPVYIEGNNLLVPAGIAVRKKDIERLSSWGIDTVETDGELTTGSQRNLAGIAEESKPAESAPSPLVLPEVQEDKGPYRSYRVLIERLDEVFTNTGSGVAVNFQTVDDIIEKLLQAVREHRDNMIRYILGGEISGHELAKSSVNTAILSAFIAMEFNIPQYKIMQIVTGALLHDVGMLKLPEKILNKRGGLSETELRSMHAHPLYAYQIICKEMHYPEEVGLVALQHHERWDGEGYPRHLAGEAIDLGSRIVSVADAFEAMVSQKPYRNSIVGYQAMKNLLSDNSRRFDPKVLKVFIKTMGIYPIGSIVLLNNGTLARVVEVQGTAPLRPKIRVLIDEFGKTYKKDAGEVINLLAEKGLFISRAVDPRGLTKRRE